MYASKTDGPVQAIVLDAPRNKPTPIVPPSAIICTCRAVKSRFKFELIISPKKIL